MKDKPNTPSNSFLAVLQRKETQVGTLSEASDLLAEAVKASCATGKKATVTLTLTLEPKLGAVNFTTKLASKLPSEAEPLCIFYADSNGVLHRDDPKQKELPGIHAVEGGAIVQPEQKLQEGAVAS